MGLFNKAKSHHIKDYKLNKNYIAKSLKYYVKGKDPYSAIFYGKQRETLINKYKKKSGDIYTSLMKGSCKIYKDLDKDIKEYRKKWKEEILKQVKSNKFPIKNLKKLKKNFTNPELSKNKDEYILAIKNSLNNIYSQYSESKIKTKFADYVSNLLKEKKALFKDKDLRPANIFKSLIRSMDPHSAYLTESEAKSMDGEMDTNKVGLGITLDMVSEGIEVIEVFKDSAAHNAGLKVGDIITRVNSLQAKDYSIQSMVDAIAGPEGSILNITVKRGDKVFDKKIKRKKFEIADAKLQTELLDYKGKKILHLYLPTFYLNPETNKGPAQDIEEALKKHKKDLIILDMRDNGGGYLDQAAETVALFQKNPIVLGQKNKEGKLLILSKESKFVDKTPLIVLINNRSASASEIVAGVLQDYGRALIVGDRQTYGKGTIQHVLPLTGFNFMSELGKIKITSGLFYLPRGLSTQFDGVKADIVIERDFLDNVGERYFENPILSDTVPPMINKVGIQKEIIKKIKKKLKFVENNAEDRVLDRTLQIGKILLD